MPSTIPPNNGIIQTPQAVIVNPPLISEESSPAPLQGENSDVKALDPGDEAHSGNRSQSETVEGDYTAGREVNDYTVAP